MNSTGRNIKRTIVLRVRILFLAMLIGSLAIVFRIFYLQNIKGDYWREKGARNQVVRKKVPSTRGNIYAADGASLLATSLPFYRLAMDAHVPADSTWRRGLDSLSLLLSRFYQDRSASEYRRLLREARGSEDRYLLLNRKYLSFEEKKRMERWPIFRLGRYKGGVIFEKTETRYTPFQKLARRAIGFLNESNGGAGLEFSYNNYLKGKSGVTIFRRMSGGNLKPILDEELPTPGLDIVTTLDINLQDVAEAALERALEQHQAKFGAVVLMEVSTGEIKAIANLTRTPEGSYIEDYNYAIALKTEPGSTFKLASYMALLEEQKIKRSDSVYAERGKFKIYERTMTDSKPGGYGMLTVQEGFEKSSNILVSKLVNKHFGGSPQKFVQYLDRFGLTADLKFQMRGYQKPYIKNPDDASWSGTTLPWMSVGYEVSMTPLQILAFYNAVANGGKMVQPLIVKRVVKGEQVIEEFEAEVLRDNICSDEVLEDVRRLLEGVVERGTAQNIKHADYHIAGKTGTAQKLVDKRYIERYYTSFAGYFPAEAPKYSCIVIIDSPQGYLQYGADVAAPVFKELADKIYARDEEMHKDLKQEPSKEDTGLPLVRGGNSQRLGYLFNTLGVSFLAPETENTWVKARPMDRAVRLQAVTLQNNQVPDVSGLLLRDALPLLENRGYRVSHTGRGRVLSQSPAMGTSLAPGNTIFLRLGD